MSLVNGVPDNFSLEDADLVRYEAHDELAKYLP
jgi:hypothetical protein